MSSDAPNYNLKAVVRETGLKPDTIRAWERRYGLPMPKRTAGGHRLYSQRDIDLLKWMNARQHEGLSASRVVDLWKSLESEGKDPLQVSTQTLVVKTVQLGELGELASLRRDWVNACAQFDEARAEQAAMQAFALFPLESVVVDVFLRGLAEIGEGWYQGEVTVQQEHFASVLVLRRLQTLIAGSPAPTRPERIVLVCPPGEQHTISLLVINLLLRRNGWDTIDLGANVPLDRLEHMLAILRPQLVLASAQHLPTAQAMLAMAALVTQLHVPLAFGGGVFNRHPGLRQRIPGHFLGERLADIPRAVQQIFHAPWPLPDVIEPSAAYQDTAQHYQEHLAEIEIEVLAHFAPAARESIQRIGANAYLAQYIIAALRLGDLSLLDADLEWIRGLISAHHLPDESLRHHLQVYLSAVQHQLDQRGAPIVDWCQRAIEELSETVSE